MAGDDLAPATITNLDTSEELKCMFRPKEYTFKKRNTWQRKPVKGKNTPELEFSGGDSATLSMELFFDTYESKADVRKYTDRILSFMKINPNKKNPRTHKSEPPRVEFRWGDAWSFKAVITDVSQTFTLFSSSGKPVRAKVNVTFQEAEEMGLYPATNPTSGGMPGHKLRMVRQGETLDWIAFEEYGDSTIWRRLADANNLDNPMRLRPGQVLSIPPL